ncbi:unnamed protein product [Mytilus coruscus]|uniref:Integrase catalytic domain-containing protein n=1 Tax=Mytilus coruscus TaxID=42192 RepID=A0A6J8CSM3_MYTCO|nr:unnamed protein product [Mytilus coruscus]
MEREIRMRELEIKEKEIAAQQALGVAAPFTRKGDQKYSKLPKFIEGQDPDVFLKSFEKLATLHKWAKSEWPVRIVPLLSGKALEAYSRLSDADGAESYQVAHKTESLVSDGAFKMKPQSGNNGGQTRGLQKDLGKRHLSYDCTEKKGTEKGKKGSFGLCVDKYKVLECVQRKDVDEGKLSGVAVNTNFDEGKGPGLEIVKGTVEGKPVSVLRDNGSSTVFVHGSLVEGMERTGKMKDIWLADGSVRNCEEVWINVTTPYISGSVLALVLDIPFADLVIGNYVNTSVPKDVCTEKVENGGNYIDQDTYQAVQTRVKKKQEDEKEEKIQVSIDKLNKHVTDNILPQVGKMYSRDELKLAKADDQSLNKVRSLVQENPGKQLSYFIMKSGILYREYVAPGEEEIYQVVLPQKYRAIVLELAHDIPLSGHLGIKKTRDRILHHYFWPDVPFRRITIDFFGPLPVTERINRYILVIVDCATRYPEAVALRSQDAETVVDSLMEVFSRVGFPEELLSDQGSNFKSSLMLEVCKLLTIEKKVSSVYHPQTNGMCEKFNGVLKRMLKAYASLEPKTRDKYLVYVLFAYREVPNDTTGFSPSELLYGRNVRGPLPVCLERTMGRTRGLQIICT